MVSYFDRWPVQKYTVAFRKAQSAPVYAEVCEFLQVNAIYEERETKCVFLSADPDFFVLESPLAFPVTTKESCKVQELCDRRAMAVCGPKNPEQSTFFCWKHKLYG